MTISRRRQSAALWPATLNAVFLFLTLLLPSSAAAANDEPCPKVSVGPLLEGRLPQFAKRWRKREALTIVALGSSSTAGAGASSPDRSYPAQLQAELRRRWPDRPVQVINAGINGQEVVDMLARLEQDVLAHRPDLVLWQFGSNGVMRGMPLSLMDSAAGAGIRRIRAAQADVVLIDLQHAPRIDMMPARDQVLRLMRELAHDSGAALFHRYRLMDAWDKRLGADYRRMLLDDRLHLNDYSYRCFAIELAQALDSARPAAVKAAKR